MAKTNINISVLIVEDDEAIISLLLYTLEQNEFSVRYTKSGEEAKAMIDEIRPDIILLDWMLPDTTGIRLCEYIRSNEETKTLPIIMISARGEESDRVEGLERGVDDYLVKPFSPKELIARINAVFRRIRPAFTDKQLNFGCIKMDTSSKEAFCNNQIMEIGPIEYKLLQSFLEYPSRVLTREQLIKRAWGHNLDVDLRTVDVHINRLRNNLKKCGSTVIVKTIRSSGYSLYDLEGKYNEDELVSVSDSEILDFSEVME